MPEVVPTNKIVINDEFRAGESQPEAPYSAPDPQTEPVRSAAPGVAPTAPTFDRERADSQIRQMNRSEEMLNYVLEKTGVTQQIRALQLENAKRDALIDYGIPRDKAVLVDGVTEAEIRQKAEALAGILSQHKPVDNRPKPPEIKLPAPPELVAGTPEADAREAEYAIRSNPELAKFLR